MKHCLLFANTGQYQNFESGDDGICDVEIRCDEILEEIVAESSAFWAFENEPVHKAHHEWEGGGRSIEDRKRKTFPGIKMRRSWYGEEVINGIDKSGILRLCPSRSYRP